MRTLKFLGSQGKFAWVSILAMIMVSAALAGCFHGSDDEDDDSDNGDPASTETDTDTPDPTDPVEPPIGSLRVQAMLELDRVAGWAGNDTFTFDASNSSVTNGAIASWTFEFGDGNTTTVEAGDDPIVEYEFERGGLYLVNLTVQGQSLDGEETVNETDVVAAAVSEIHYIVDGGLAASLPLGLGDGEGDSWDYVVRAGASAFNATFNVTDESSAIEDSEGWAAFEYDSDELANETFVGGGAFSLEGEFGESPPGDYTLSIFLEQGEIEFTGVLKIYYGVDPSDLPDPE